MANGGKKPKGARCRGVNAGALNIKGQIFVR